VPWYIQYLPQPGYARPLLDIFLDGYDPECAKEINQQATETIIIVTFMLLTGKSPPAELEIARDGVSFNEFQKACG